MLKFWKRTISFLAVSGGVLLMLPQMLLAAPISLSVTSNDWSFKPTPVVPDSPATIYVRVHNYGVDDIEGYLQMVDNSLGLGQEKNFAVRSGGVGDFWFRWQPTAGTHKLTLSIFDEVHNSLPINADPYVIIVLADNDRDGIPNDSDPDDDNDGLTDIYEMTYDLNPLNPQDKELDYDGDSLSNIREFFLGTNPRKADTDGDGVNDNLDPAPRDPTIPAKPVVTPKLVVPTPVITKPPVVPVAVPVKPAPVTVPALKPVVVPQKIAEVSPAPMAPPTPVIPEVVPTIAALPAETWVESYGLDVLGIGLMIIIVAGLLGFIIYSIKKQQEHDI